MPRQMLSLDFEHYPSTVVDAHRSVVAKPRAAGTARAARGYAIGHHGEILQGVFENSDGRLVRGLVSLVTPAFRSQAVFRPDRSASLAVTPHWKVKALRAAGLALDRFGVPRAGTLTILSRIKPQWGFGSSTCDVVAALRAVSRAVGRPLAPEAIASLAVEAEQASDSTMFGDRVVLFAQRRGHVIEDLGGQLPKVHVIGFNTDASGEGVSTLAFPPARYDWREIEAFRPLLGLLRRSVQRQDGWALGYVASASARINQRYLQTHQFDALEKIVEKVGGVGLQVAHSGTLAGALMPDDDAIADRQSATRRYLREIGIKSQWHFSTRW